MFLVVHCVSVFMRCFVFAAWLKMSTMAGRIRNVADSGMVCKP